MHVGHHRIMAFAGWTSVDLSSRSACGQFLDIVCTRKIQTAIASAIQLLAGVVVGKHGDHPLWYSCCKVRNAHAFRSFVSMGIMQLYYRKQSRLRCTRYVHLGPLPILGT